MSEERPLPEPPPVATPPAERWPGPGLDLADISALLLDMVIPKYADGGTVFVLERAVAGLPDPVQPGHPRIPEPRDGDPIGQIVARRMRPRFLHDIDGLADSGLPGGEVFAFPADSPYGRCLTSGAVRFGQPDQVTMGRIRPGGRAILSRFSSFLAVPMTADSTATGILVVVRDAGAGPFSDSDISAISGLAGRAGVAVARAAEFARHRLDADALRRGMAPAVPPLPDRVEVAWRSTPAPGQLMGGDWWDIITLPGERTGLLVGDVMGHGPAAAMRLAQLRAAAHTLADLDLQPAEMMGRLDRSTAAVTSGLCATCVYAVVDPAEDAATISLAGHLSPVLALPDGRTHIPAIPSGMPVGLGNGEFGQARIKLPPGSVLALYTDGLVDSRTRSFEHGIRALRDAISGEHGALTGTCDTLIESLRHHEDDVTVMLARIPPAA